MTNLDAPIPRHPNAMPLPICATYQYWDNKIGGVVPKGKARYTVKASSYVAIGQANPDFVHFIDFRQPVRQREVIKKAYYNKKISQDWAEKFAEITTSIEPGTLIGFIATRENMVFDWQYATLNLSTGVPGEMIIHLGIGEEITIGDWHSTKYKKNAAQWVSYLNGDIFIQAKAAIARTKKTAAEALHNPLNKLGELVEANLQPFDAKLEEMFGTCNVIFDKVFNQIAQLNTEFNKKASAYQKDIADLTQEFLKLKQENAYLKAKADQKAITTQKDIADLKQQLADLKQELKNAI
jgi:hypothetical protein